jgi:hypothetical protein
MFQHNHSKGKVILKSLFLGQAVMHREFIHEVTVLSKKRLEEVYTGGSLPQGGWPKVRFSCIRMGQHTSYCLHSDGLWAGKPGFNSQQGLGDF